MPTDPRPTEPVEFLRRAEKELLETSVEAQQADWVYCTYITPDSEALSSKASARLIDATVRLVKEAAHLPPKGLSAEQARKAKLLRLSLTTVAPGDPMLSERLTKLVASMQGAYAKGRHTPAGAKAPLDLQALSRILTESRDPAVLEDVWTGWHRVGRTVRPEFVEYVDLSNRGAREIGFADTGAMWRSMYDMDPDAFAKEVDRLWAQVRPFYDSLHGFVRHRLRSVYGPDRVPERGLIPAHLLGNMWAQSWEGVYPLLAPPGSDPGFDLTRLLVDRGTTPTEMVRYAERFFVSLGLPSLPASFWERSMLVRPQDREVVCHASAWDIDYAEDLRIKMCIEITGEDFHTIHHELGHNYYQRAYGSLPFLYRGSAHDGFHEAVGDTVDLSVTPEYLSRIGLLKQVPDASSDTGLLLQRALEKVAFLPFGLVIDKWRWSVFSGEIAPADYNRTWWAMRAEYQGVAPPRPRDDEEFDPGAKFHVPSSVPYMRYFLAHILQFQFHRALVKTAGIGGPLHRASIYGSKEAGRRLAEMLSMGASREWPDALEAVTGDRRMDATGLLEYFAPLRRWLDEQNRQAPVGW
ncbi:MAG: M2 family metallopeptidase [Thermoplasmata archaeon]|nr:M2 family metallopeptidase [Thermoplasmata archaeon]